MNGTSVTLEQLAKEDQRRAASRSVTKANAKMRKGH